MPTSSLSTSSTRATASSSPPWIPYRLDMVQLQGSGLTPNASYTAYAARGDDQVPLVSFVADAKGKAPQVLAFVKFLGVYDIDRVQVRPSPAAPGAGAPGTGK